MSSVIEEFPAKHRGRPNKYDWDLYMDGKNWKCVQGQDFHVSAVSFRALVHRTARTRGLKAETRINKAKTEVLFRVFKEK